MMTRSFFTLVLVTALSVTAFAGTIVGKVSPGNSVVYVDTIAGKIFPAPSQKRMMNQKGLMFNPKLLIVQTGTTVEFQNDDSVQHNVFWPSISGNKKLGHNLGTWPKGDRRPFKFDSPGVVPLLCNVHPEMSGYIIVSPTPYFAETDASGNYKIENVPDGKYNVVAWHEGMKQQSKSVAVAGTGKADFTLSK
ncbi:MAG TPA: carboxypeptidase regulatory-like domain-containing protein [Terriglobales bacterium]|jgi:plastocyanin